MMLATYCYLNQNGQLIDNFPMTRWIPVLAIIIYYTAFGFGTVPMFLQVGTVVQDCQSINEQLNRFMYGPHYP